MAVAYHSIVTDDLTSGAGDRLVFATGGGGGTDADVIYVHASLWANNFATVQAVTTPAGWTEVYNALVTSASRRIVIAYRVGDYAGSEEFVATSGTNLTAAGSCTRYTGAFGGVSEGAITAGSAEDAVAASIADGAVDDMLVVVGGGGQESVGDLSFSTPAGFTLRQNLANNSSSDAGDVVMLDKAITVAGATGAVTLDQSSPGTAVGTRVGVGLLLKERAPGGWSVGSIRF